MKVEELKNFLRLRGLRTYEEVDLSPQNSFQSPECAVHRSGILGDSGAMFSCFNNYGSRLKGAPDEKKLPKKGQ